ncbi:hypothetical protein RF55_22035 [Lasius niger]|uniref:Uncharacterized protein n=1 Tax=Lasius niger TaxID=67767 RepID=A0A0J7MQ81_LASNI|nr:hypothetical protein RF55_22035 [Lasius niger]
MLSGKAEIRTQRTTQAHGRAVNRTMIGGGTSITPPTSIHIRHAPLSGVTSSEAAITNKRTSAQRLDICNAPTHSQVPFFDNFSRRQNGTSHPYGARPKRSPPNFTNANILTKTSPHLDNGRGHIARSRRHVETPDAQLRKLCGSGHSNLGIPIP